MSTIFFADHSLGMGTIDLDQLHRLLLQSATHNPLPDIGCCMGDVITLRIHRKRVMRLQKTKVATRQRIKHGAAKQTRMLGKALDLKNSRNLDQHRLETGEGQ